RSQDPASRVEPSSNLCQLFCHLGKRDATSRAGLNLQSMWRSLDRRFALRHRTAFPNTFYNVDERLAPEGSRGFAPGNFQGDFAHFLMDKPIRRENHRAA